MNILKSINKKRKKRNCIIKQIRIIILSLLHIVKNKLFRVRLKTALKNTFLFFELKKTQKTRLITKNCFMFYILKNKKIRNF